LNVPFAAWVALVIGLVGLLLLDLFVLHRGVRVVSIRDAAWSTAGFIAISVAFGIALGILEGWEIAQEFFAGYLLEQSLSLDNVFVWALIFSGFSVPPAYQRRVLFYGVFGALVLRLAFVAAGAELLAHFEWIVYVFGALLLWSGVRMLRGGRHFDAGFGAIGRVAARLPTTEGFVDHHLIVRAHDLPKDQRPKRPPIWGRWYATPLLAVVVVIEFSDLIFAVDSIPAIYGVTREPFIVYSATALALLGLRSMYFLFAGLRDRFGYLDVGLALLLVFIGAKFMLTEVIEIGPGISLLVIAAIMTAAIVFSLLRRDECP
jgi:tellurite resistance protein TerC